MKKMIIFLLIAVVALAAPVSVYAAEASLNPGGQKDIDVYAKYTLSLPDNMQLSQITGGRAVLTAASGGGVVLTFSGNNYDGYSAYLIELSDEGEDAYSWLSGIIGGGEFTAYCLIFNDENGNAVKIEESFTVTVTKPQGYGDVIVYTVNAAGNKNTASVSTQDGKLVFSLSGNAAENMNTASVSAQDDKLVFKLSVNAAGNMNTASVSTQDNKLSFNLSGSNYFVIANKGSGGDDNPGDSPKIDDDKPGDSPQTGDNSSIIPLVLAMLSSGTLAVVIGRKKYRLRKGSK